MAEMDTLTIVRWRLANGRTIADSDVHKLVAQIDQLKAELSEAVERGNDWCDQAKKARAERDGANALIDRMRAQDALAIQAWQKANPGNDLRWPGSIRLSAWCLGEIANLEAERDRLREALQWMVDNDETNEGDAPMPELGGQSWNDINAYYIDGLNRARAALKETGDE
jgi:hypothetical protein